MAFQNKTDIWDSKPLVLANVFILFLDIKKYENYILFRA